MKLNFKVLLFIGLMLTVELAKAQSNKVQQVSFGVKVGANLTTLGTFTIFDKKYDYDYKTGLVAGLFSEISLLPKLNLVAEANYSEKGANVEANISGFIVNVKQRLNFLDIPIAVSYEALPKFSVFAGPQAAFILSQRSETFYNGVSNAKNTDTDKIAKPIISAIAGLNYQYKRHLIFNGRYMFDVKKGAKDKDPMFEDVRNSGFSLTVGYKL
ncbi:MAG TPA: porin family protein [Pelobium sp.]